MSEDPGASPGPGRGFDSRVHRLRDSLRHLSRPIALLGLVLTCVLSLSVHVVMLQVFHVPYPEGYPTTGWSSFLSLALSAFALFYFYDLSRDEFQRFSPLVRCLLLFVLVAMVREALIRKPVMDGFATTAWRYSIIDNLPRLLTVLLLCSMVIVAAPWARRLWQRLLGAVVIGAVLEVVFRPGIAKIFEHIMASIAYLSHDAVYTVPYGWQIEVPAYLTYMEPVLACFVMVALIWDRMARGLLRRTAWFVLLILMITGSLTRPFAYLVYSRFRPMVALLSMGQFFLEVVVLALLTTVTWRMCQRPAAGATPAMQTSM